MGSLANVLDWRVNRPFGACQPASILYNIPSFGEASRFIASQRVCLTTPTTISCNAHQLLMTLAQVSTSRSRALIGTTTMRLLQTLRTRSRLATAVSLPR